MRPLIALALILAAPAAAQTLLVGNKGEDTLGVHDLATGRELARVPTGPKPHEVAISPDGTLAAVVSYGGHTIDLVDIRQRRRVRIVELLPDAAPHGLVWLNDGRIVATTEQPGALVVVNPANNVVARVPTNARGSHMVAVAPSAGRAFVANMDSGTVSVIDLRAMRKVADLPVGGRPEGIAVALGERQLWVGDNDAGRVRVYDIATLKPLGEVAVPRYAIRVVASPDGRTVATSNIEHGSVSLIDAATRRLKRTIPVSGSRDAAQVTLLFSDDGRRLYAAETGPDRVAEIDLASGKVLRRIPVGRDGDGLAIAP